MNTLKHILQNYEAKLDDKIDYLVEAGLFEEKKVGMLKRAINKNPNNLTMAESKVLKEFVDNVVSQLLYEKQDHLSAYDKKMNKNKNVDKELPTVIILKRKAIRVYPDNQKIALYYSQALDRYISIPYGPKGEALGMTMNESIDTKVNPQNSNKIPSANPKSPSEREMKKDVDTGDILKMMKKNEPANPRMNFAPSADPKMRIDEKSAFRKNLEHIREKNENLDEALVPILRTIAQTGAIQKGIELGKKGIEKGYNALKQWKKNKEKSARKQKRQENRKKRQDIKDKSRKNLDVNLDVGDSDKNTKFNLDLSDISKPTDQSVYGGRFGNIMQNRVSGPGRFGDTSLDAQGARIANTLYGNQSAAMGATYPKNTYNESNLSIIKKLSKSKSFTEQVLPFGESSVTINKGTAKKVMKVYNSLNESNKKKMENMLSESATSFKKAIQFAVRH